MSLWEKAQAELLDIIEWTDDSSDTMVWRFPRFDNEIKYGAQLIVRQSQVAVFVNMGKIADVFPPGKHKLMTDNMPVLTTLMGWQYGFHSPFKAEVYFVNTKNFTNLKWGTKNPVILRDPEFGAVRIRSFGSYVIKVSDPAKFINEIAGTSGRFVVEEIEDQLRNLVVTRFSDLVGESGIPLLDLASKYDELSKTLASRVLPEFAEYGLEVTKLLIENIALPPEVEAALDKKSSMGIIGDMDTYLKFQSGTAMEAAAKNPGGEASAGIGMGIGFAMANQLGKAMSPQTALTATPPPLDAPKQYFVGKDGKQSGPYPIEAISKEISEGRVTRDTLLWCAGMEKWQMAGEFSEFSHFFTTPPPLT
ncbi:MAG: SPFH domain-containing protein [Geobacteraceae bacterium]|nr:SPFH domain-containing protein [Geobacteraceae bacterium]